VDKTLNLSTDLGVFLVAVAMEVTVGILIGLIASMIFMAVQLAGQLIDQELGLSLANVIDPITNQQVSVIGQLKLFVAVLIYLSIDGHHYLITGILKSFHTVPLVGFSVSQDFAIYVSDTLVQDLLKVAFVIGAPVVASVLLVTIAMGFMARVFPQLNIFIVGFSVRILVGMLVLLVSVSTFAVVMRKHLNDFNGTLYKVIDLMKG
jgi:flagellar biosynthetic protein FliR